MLYKLRVNQGQKNVPAARMNLQDENSDSSGYEHIDYKWITLEEVEDYLNRYMLRDAKHALEEAKKYSIKFRLL